MSYLPWFRRGFVSEARAALSPALVTQGRRLARFDVPCGACEGDGYHETDTGGNIWQYRCPDCNGTGRTPHPLVAHLRSPGPHWRGCWGVDLLTGRE
jgi:hypothetical protein